MIDYDITLDFEFNSDCTSFTISISVIFIANGKLWFILLIYNHSILYLHDTLSSTYWKWQT